jgi:hypothetical protein
LNYGGAGWEPKELYSQACVHAGWQGTCRDAGLLRFQFNARVGAPPQTVLQHGKAGQRPIALNWKRNQS